MSEKMCFGTKDMIKFWAIGMVAMLVVVFFTCVLFFGFVASTFGG